MLLTLQAAPLLLLLALLGSGRAGPVGACLAALALAVPAALLSLPAGAAPLAFLLEEAGRAGFLGLQPVSVVAGGLLFHAAVSPAAGPAASPRAATPAAVFAVSLPLGAFLESVTGFAVGAVFALSSLRAMGLRGPATGALALQALVLVPWGALGPGTTVGAALAGIPGQQLALAAAPPSAAWLVALAPVLWSLSARCGVPVPPREKLVQLAALGAIAGLLLLANRFLPFEVAGLLATGLPLPFLLWRTAPETRLAAAARLAFPYLLLVAVILLARLWHGAPALHPFDNVPGFGLTHVGVLLLLVGALLLLARPGPAARAGAAFRRAAKPALAMLLYVLLGRLLAGSGAAGGLARALAEALGGLAPYAVPWLGFLSGIVTGSNVGSNSALMAIQQGIGGAAGLPPGLAPGVHNFTGAAGAGLGFTSTALVVGLLADGTTQAQLWRLLAPSMMLVLGLGMLAMAVGQ